MPENDEPKIATLLKRYALFYGPGAAAGIKALKMDLISLPPEWKLYISYFFSLILMACILLGGTAVAGWLRQGVQIVKDLQEIKKTQKEVAKEPPKT